MLVRVVLVAALSVWALHPAACQDLLDNLPSPSTAPSQGLLEEVRRQLERVAPQWLNASEACNDVKRFSSPTLEMLRAHFAESTAHFTSIDVPSLTQKLGTDYLVSKMVCVNEVITQEGFAGSSGVRPFKIDDNQTDFIVDRIGDSWSTRDVEATGKRSPLLRSVSRVDASSGDYKAPNGRKYRFEVVKHHYDFVCTSAISASCAPVDQVHCEVPSLGERGQAYLLGRTASTGSCWVRQQPIRMSTDKSSVAAQLQLPLLSLSYANLDPHSAQNYTAQSRERVPAMTTNTVPGINDANYTRFVPVRTRTDTQKRGPVTVHRSGAWRAVPSEVLERQFCAGDGTSVKTSITPDQSINGGFPFVVQESRGDYCLLELNYDQVQTVANVTGHLGATGTAIRGLGRTLATGSCAPGQLPIVRAVPNWDGTVPLYNELNGAGDDFIRDDICLEKRDSYGSSQPGFKRCLLSYCSPLYLPNFAGVTLRVETIDGANNYTRYGDNSWPRNQFVPRNSTSDDSRGVKNADGVLCDTNLTNVTPLMECLQFCQRAGRPINSLKANVECQRAPGISDTCRELLGNHKFSILQFGVEMPGDLAQTGTNSELSNNITRTTANTFIDDLAAVPSYVGQTTLMSAPTMGADIAPFGCAVDIGTYADGLEAQAVKPASAGNKQLGMVQALLNATTSVNLLSDDNFLLLVAQARVQATDAGNELTRVGVATAIASSVASLVGILELVHRRKTHQVAFPVRGTSALGVQMSPHWTWLTLPVLMVIVAVLCAVGLLPIILGLIQEINAINTSSVVSNINAGKPLMPSISLGVLTHEPSDSVALHLCIDLLPLEMGFKIVTPAGW